MKELLCDWQPDLFNQDPPTELEDLRTYILTLKESHEKLRKGIFVRVAEMSKKIGEQKSHIFLLQRMLKEMKNKIDHCIRD